MSPDDVAGPRERIRLALWTHQTVEYLLAVLLVLQSINAGPAATYVAIAGGVLFVLAATTDAAMGAVRWIHPQVHRVLDFVVIAALVLAPVLSGTTEIVAWVMCFLAAAAVAWLNWHTQWARAPRRVRRPQPTGETGPATPAPRAASLGDAARDLGKTVDRTTRGASRAAGRVYGRARARRPRGGDGPRGAA